MEGLQGEAFKQDETQRMVATLRKASQRPTKTKMGKLSKTTLTDC